MTRRSDGRSAMGWGLFLLILGGGSVLLPRVGYQITLMELVRDVQPYAGILVAVIGAVLLLLAMTRGATNDR